MSAQTLYFLVEEELYFHFPFTNYRSEIEERAAKLQFFENMAFNFLSKLVNRPENIGEDDEGSPVDDVDEEIGDESDVECDGEEDNETSVDLDSDLDLDLNSSDADDVDDGVEAQGDTGFAWSDQLHNVEIELFTAHSGPKLGDLDIDYTSDPYDFFKLFIRDPMITTIKEQTNLYAQQKEAARFRVRPVTYDDINVFLYINMMFGVHKMPALHLYWSKGPLLRVPPVADAISRDRFKKNI